MFAPKRGSKGEWEKYASTLSHGKARSGLQMITKSLAQ